jgi:hypothetical protein
MPQTQSLMSLHRSYRLCIAEMNFDINVLRIFDDSLQELASVKPEPALKEGIKHFEQQFIMMRKEIDEMKHEMHLVKMKLAANSKEVGQSNETTHTTDNHGALKKAYSDFRKKFDAVKKEYKRFEDEWMQ